VSKSRDGYRLSPEAIREDRVFNFRHYFNNIRAFDEFPGEKILVRYEDLVLDFTEVSRILDFFELSYDLSKFDIEEHRVRSVEIYDDQHRSFTKSALKELRWHQSRADPAVLRELDDIVERHYADLARRYLKWRS